MATKSAYKIDITAAVVPDMNNPETITPAKAAADALVEKFKNDLAAVSEEHGAVILSASVTFQPSMRVPDAPASPATEDQPDPDKKGK